jgi:hypothetical protein
MNQDPASVEEKDNDFELVPQDRDLDTNLWDAEGENEDDVKRVKIRSKSFKWNTSLLLTLPLYPIRIWPHYPRSCYNRATACQSKKDTHTAHQ